MSFPSEECWHVEQINQRDIVIVSTQLMVRGSFPLAVLSNFYYSNSSKTYKYPKVNIIFNVMRGKIVELSVTCKINWVVSKNCIQIAAQPNPSSAREPQVTLYQATSDIITKKEKKSSEFIFFFLIWQTKKREEKRPQTKETWPELDNTTKSKTLLCDE